MATQIFLCYDLRIANSCRGAILGVLCTAISRQIRMAYRKLFAVGRDFRKVSANCRQEFSCTLAWHLWDSVSHEAALGSEWIEVQLVAVTLVRAKISAVFSVCLFVCLFVRFSCTYLELCSFQAYISKK